MIMISQSNLITMNQIILGLNSTFNERAMRNDFIKQLQDLIPFDAASFFLIGNEFSNEIEDKPVQLNLQDDYMELYKKELIKEDMVVQKLCSNRPFIYRFTDLSDNRSDNVFSNFLKPQGLLYAQGMNLRWRNQILGGIILFRNKQKPNFSYRDLFLLSQFQGHLSFHLYQETAFQIKNQPIKKELMHDFNITKREMEILDLLAKRCTNQEIADTLYIELSTVKTHLKNIFRKLGIKSRSEINIAGLTDNPPYPGQNAAEIHKGDQL